ncbi:MAG: hypothetical protein U5O39_17010 [Gammaproteobacteria bacterium]|nr:hypothetical protein [Gammaproteobacteria bacterium]
MRAPNIPSTPQHFHEPCERCAPHGRTVGSRVLVAGSSGIAISLAGRCMKCVDVEPALQVLDAQLDNAVLELESKVGTCPGLTMMIDFALFGEVPLQDLARQFFTTECILARLCRIEAIRRPLDHQPLLVGHLNS